MAVPGGGNIKVVVRVRPFNSREKDRNAQCIVSMKDTQTVLIPPSNDPNSKSKPVKAALEGNKTFAFDKSYWSFSKDDTNYAGQEDLFTDLGKPLLDNAFQGYNNCIFAYGQTGSGKSYSMMGYGPEQGVIPRICRNMFERIDGVQVDKNMTCTVEVSYLEIYNERVRDLLNPSNKGNLKVREHPSTGPYVEDLAKLVVRSFAEIENLMDEGNKARTVAATNMNETSSRSHAVFTLTLTQKRHDTETNMDTEKVAKISLVDLAGSERATSTGATGARLKEGAEINRSLSTLGRVIAALADMSTGKPKTKGMQVPYRDSVLTWLLKDSLGGNSLTAMIAAISPADINFEETLSTLRYADSAKRIKNHAVVNEDPNARMIRELKEELAQLRAKLSTGGTVAEEQYSADTPLDKQIVSITQADGSIKKVSKAEIAEQLSQSEKLYLDLNQTWEEKMKKTEEIHKEREAALEELGISIEKGFVGLSTPKKMPHLVNLSDDPLLAECLVYNLKPGTTTVGSIDNPEGDGDGGHGSTVDIRLNGSKILADHCTFENVDGVVTVVPKDGAAIMVNGLRIEAPQRLRTGYRVILGDFHIFRFNHPQEAREERAEQGSLLKYSVTADQLGTPDRPMQHERTSSSVSRAMSDIDEGIGSPRTESPTPWRPQGRDSDWAFARREAISALIGPEQKMATLTDDELDVLFEDLQKVRAVRKARPESRIFDSRLSELNGTGDNTDTESVTSHLPREKYLSNGTLDNFSLDTALTIPSTPQQPPDEEERLKQVREGMQERLDEQKVEYQQELKAAEEGSAEMEDVRTQKAKMEADLQEMKQKMQAELRKELDEQKAEYEKQIADLKTPTRPRRSSRKKSLGGAGSGWLDDKDIYLAKNVLEHWRRQRYIAVAAGILKHAALLKEAQVMSQQMGRDVVFQFTIVDVGHTFGSTYDLVMNDVSAEERNDAELDDSIKPSLGIRVIDFRKNVIYLWSVRKLQGRVRAMRQMTANVERGPEYMQHFRVENAFEDTCMPQYTRVGDANIPLAAVFQCRVQDFSLDVFSPYTSSVVGIIRLSLEPSSAQAPKEMLKFNVVMHDLIGFAEREGSEVHAQLFIPGISEEGGATTTTMISGFEEGPVRFESVHSMSLPISSPPDPSLRVSVFAKGTSMHMDKLLSWDDMRDASSKSSATIRGRNKKPKRQGPRLSEREFHTDERHDVFCRVQVLEIGENGQYAPVEVVQASTLDSGVYQLHQGLQRRIVLSLTLSSGDVLPLDSVNDFRAGGIQLLDASGRVDSTDLDNGSPDVSLPLVAPTVISSNEDGSTQVKLIGQWDSSAHNSLLLDRPAGLASDEQSVRLSLKWSATSGRVSQPLKFSFDIAVQTRPRTWFRQHSLLAKLFHNQRVVHSTASNYEITLRPAAVKRAGDLWRLDTSNEYVSGQERINGWAPRGVSLVKDFVDLRKRQRRVAEIESARGSLSLSDLEPPQAPVDNEDGPDGLTDKQRNLIEKTLKLWRTAPSVSEVMLLRSESGLPEPHESTNGLNGKDDANEDDEEASRLAGSVDVHAKNPSILKSGWLLAPDHSGTRWLRRYVELRRPYLHLFSSDGDEIMSVNLTHSRIDADPQVARLLQRDNVRLEVWAIYATNKAWLFACRNDRERGEWIWAVDRSYVGSGGSSSGDYED